jgi:ankyrin repeat protein
MFQRAGIESALHMACAAGNIALATTLLDAGANIEIRNHVSVKDWCTQLPCVVLSELMCFLQRYETPLLAVFTAERLDTLDLLLSRGANVNVPYPVADSPHLTDTALLRRVAKGDFSSVKKLIAAGANVNAVDAVKHA